MTTQTHNTQQGLVKDLRKIRDQISNEIKDMTFEEERAYLDKLLTGKEKSASSKNSSGSGAEH
jgi:protein gp37